MRRLIPLASFEHETQAVLAADDDGSVRFCNHAARRLLGLAPSHALPSRCWLLDAFRATDGSRFCGPRCPVQQAARDGSPGARHWVVARTGTSAGRTLELVSFFVPTGRSTRSAVLHFLQPVVADVENVSGLNRGVDGAIALACGITDREADVLARVADGLSTAAVAAELGIATTTVRNHVQSIFRKLGVHRRIEAVVAFGRAVATASHRSDASAS
jgi:DNA-binding CsgD family transcriptional regulator